VCGLGEISRGGVLGAFPWGVLIVQGATLFERRVRVRTLFTSTFGREPTLVVAAPGRVNLIGEHTDYNQGFVLPVAISRYVVLAAAERRDGRVLLQAANLSARVEFSLRAIDRDEEQPWSNYQRGVALQLQQVGYALRGMEALIWGDVPVGSGLSSSAAVEVATAYAFKLLSGLKIGDVELALLCQRAESEFVGVDCGMMDQLVAVLGKRDHALLIDCRDLSTEQVPIPEGAAIVVSDSMKRRELRQSAYNERRQECQQGARLLGVESLREISIEEFAARERELPEQIRQRCRHVVNENQRVIAGVGALRRDDLEEFGGLMRESHRSLRDDYQVSSPELDLLVEAAAEVEGVYGSRLTGAGFGGCTVSLVRQDAVQEFSAHVARRYHVATGVHPQVYVCRAEDGAASLAEQMEK
jgi:galactokinase